MSAERIKRAGSDPTTLTPAREAALRHVADLPDHQIDLTHPGAPATNDWSNSIRGRLYKPVKALKSLRIDTDVLAYFQAQGPGYQTRINRTLRAAMLRDLRRSNRS